MSSFTCPREPELLALLRSGRFPSGSPVEGDQELHAHAASCNFCKDLLEVAAALLDDREALLADAPIPGSGLVWWRLQMRRRHEAARSARRALLVVQVACVALAGGAALAMLQTLVPGWTVAALKVLHVGSPLTWSLAVVLGLLALGGLASRAASRRRATSSPS